MHSEASAASAGMQLRPMGIGDILDATFRLYKNNFATYLLIALVVFVPYALATAMFSPAPQNPMEAFRQATERASNPQDPFAGWNGEVDTSALVVTYALLIVYVVVLWPLCQGAMVHNISASYLGERLGAGESYGRAAPRLLKLLGTNILAGVFILLGMVACIVPGIILSLHFWIVPAAVMLEGLGGMTALKRCWALTKGNLGKAFLLGLTVALLSWVVAMIFSSVILFLPLGGFLTNFLSVVLQALVLPFQIAAIILFYYDLRIRKEAFDLERMAQEMEAAPA